MKDLGRKVKTLVRRRNYLKRRVDKLKEKNTSQSYDAAEISALSDAIEVMSLYRDSIDGKGNVYQAIDFAAETLDEVLKLGTLPDSLQDKVASSIDSCEDSLDIIDGMRNASPS